MKLSQYAKKVGVTYRTAFRWWQNGDIKGYQLPSGTIVVTEGEEPQVKPDGQVAIYARVSSHEHRANLDRQAERLEDYCAAKGYQVSKVVKEIGSGVNDNRAKFLALLENQQVRTIVVEQKDRATRFGFRYLDTLLKGQGRAIEVVKVAENNREDVLADLVSIVTHYVGSGKSRHQAAHIKDCIAQAMHLRD
jgi:putative resolvase